MSSHKDRHEKGKRATPSGARQVLNGRQLRTGGNRLNGGSKPNGVAAGHAKQGAAKSVTGRQGLGKAAMTKAGLTKAAATKAAATKAGTTRTGRTNAATLKAAAAKAAPSKAAAGKSALVKVAGSATAGRNGAAFSTSAKGPQAKSAQAKSAEAKSVQAKSVVSKVSQANGDARRAKGKAGKGTVMPLNATARAGTAAPVTSSGPKKASSVSGSPRVPEKVRNGASGVFVHGATRATASTSKDAGSTSRKMTQRNPNGHGPNGDASSAPAKAAKTMAGATKVRVPLSQIVLPANYRPSDSEPFMNERQRAYFRHKLVAWKEDIVRQSRETLQGLNEGGSQHADLADRATSEADRALELRARDRQRKLISKIDAALARIEDGSYGYCEETGEPIGLKRLDARPIATMSIEAQERHERRERVFRDD